jgi:hypothetical protein
MPSKPALKIESDYRSRLEQRIAKQLEAEGVEFGYETLKLSFDVPARKAKYTPDFLPKRSPIIIEAKGYFRTTADRQRLIQVKESNPTIDLRLVFQDANKPIYKGSPTSYGKWATDHGFPWADKGTVPAKWIAEIKKSQKK